MKANFPLIDVTRFPSELREPMLPAARAVQQIRDMLQAQLSISDNHNAAVVSVTMTHGTESGIKNPLRGLPVGFSPIYAVSTTTGKALQTETGAGLNLFRDDGLLGLTVNFAPPAGLQIVTRVANQSIANNTITTVVYDTTMQSLGSAISLSSGVFTCAESGIVAVDGQIFWDANAAGYREAWILQTGGYRWSDSLGTPNGAVANYASHNLSATIPVTAGDTLQTQIYQNSGGNLNLSQVGISGRNHLSMRYVAPSVTTSATVTGILWGG